MSVGTRHLTAHGPQKSPAPIPRAGTEIVGHHAAADPSVADFGVFVERNPALLDKRLLTRHYTAAALASPQASTGLVVPDVVAFPWTSGRDGPAHSPLQHRTAIIPNHPHPAVHPPPRPPAPP